MRQKLFNDFLNRFVKTALWFYFAEIKVNGKWKDLKDVPIIIVANHQNALLDPLLIATYINLKPHFLSRASVFKNPIIAKILAFIRMVPVYRIRDGFGSIPGNKASFSYCEKVLKNQGKVLIFPEGKHSLKRQVRPLSKGFTRIISEALRNEPEMDLRILPIGINYQAHQKSGSKVLIDVGEPIPAKQYTGQERILLEKVEKELQSLTLHLPEDNYDESLKMLLQSNKDIRSYRWKAETSSIGPAIASEYNHTKWRNWVFKALHFPLWLIWKFLKPKINDTVFYGTVKFCLGIVTAPIYYLSVFYGIYSFTSLSFALICILLMFLSIKLNRNWYNQTEEELIKK
ncbi:1-acyl-sn-glycerol-3-phosphate acyltransferase [uncultured Cyclobacterium sp.]|uniref:1-acyl-sn-glycerol-3-phosphate acyltransferase n=1 Tax=uncultured Cyclobacterium sp. TaxID=453820 RepID=UPI0030EDECB2|tara:strand:+ start:107647 stop:108678 length:1032 start_codon:yes stop_codon:yes gene_type:complete